MATMLPEDGQRERTGRRGAVELNRRTVLLTGGGVALAGLAAAGTWALHGNSDTAASGRTPSSMAPTSPSPFSPSPTDPAQATSTRNDHVDLIGPGATVVFQGDSITDAKRDRSITAPNKGPGLGSGYVHMVVSTYLSEHPAAKSTFYNRGISGDIVSRVRRRWDKDTAALRPDLVSILIGINDFWRTKRLKGYRGTPAIYHRELVDLLDHVGHTLPEARVVLCVPFVLDTGVVKEGWRADLAPYQQTVRAQAAHRNLVMVDFQEMFDTAGASKPPSHWSADGIHPTPAGAALMARTWLARVAGR